MKVSQVSASLKFMATVSLSLFVLFYIHGVVRYEFVPNVATVKQHLRSDGLHSKETCAEKQCKE